jgi:SAM-dependent methyltransferase
MLIRFLALLRQFLKASGLLPLVKRTLYAPRAPAAAELPNASGWRYRIKALIEQANYAAITQVHDLPPIYGYWMKRHILPQLRSLGYESPTDYFVNNMLLALRAPGEGLRRCASIGSGNCDFEVELATLLLANGVDNFVIECVDFNREMLRRGEKIAAEKNVSRHIVPVQADFNEWVPSGPYDVILANMSLHHVVNLENLFDRVKSSLAPSSGRFITSDIIGRNGHMRWPEALSIVNEFWRQAPEKYRYNQMLGKLQEEYVNFDCSRSGFEGIRAQDILPLLLDRFHFESFFAFANVIECFVDRAVGGNFDPQLQADRDFIDRVHARDVEEMKNGQLTPTHMLAVMSAVPTPRQEHIEPLTARFCAHPA